MMRPLDPQRLVSGPSEGRAEDFQVLLPSQRWLGRLVTAGALGPSWPQPRMGLERRGQFSQLAFFHKKLKGLDGFGR